MKKSRNTDMPQSRYDSLDAKMDTVLANLRDVSSGVARLDERSINNHEAILTLAERVGKQNGRVGALEKKWWIALGATFIILSVAGFIGEKFWTHITVSAQTTQQP
jgi:hypothetical protein